MIPDCFVDYVPPPRTPLVGVYSLLFRGVPVYVGRTSNLEQRVLAHQYRTARGRKHDCWRFDRVIWFAVAEADLAAYEGAIARAWNPRHTKRVSRDTSRDVEILARLGIAPDETRAFERRVDAANRKHGLKLRDLAKQRRQWRAEQRTSSAERVRAFVEAA